MADTQWNIEYLLATAVAYMRDVGMPNEADAIIELQRRAATKRPEITVTAPMLRAAIDFVSPDGTDDQDECELTLFFGKYDDGRSGVFAYITDYPEEGHVFLSDADDKAAATPPADAALADAVALLRRTYQNHWPSTEIKAFLAKIDAMPDAALRALSQPEVAQVPIEWRRAVHDLMSLTGFRPLCQKNVMDACRCYECVMERVGALVDAQSALSAAPSAKGGE